MSALNGFKEVTEVQDKKFENSTLAKQLNHTEKMNNTNYDAPIVKEVRDPIKNKSDGLHREQEVYKELGEKYPPKEKYTIISEAYLRDKNSTIVKDPVTNTARRIDFVVVKESKVVDSIEVTSKTADKTNQIAKEERIRASGGNYIKDNTGNLIKIPTDIHTHIERRD